MTTTHDVLVALYAGCDGYVELRALPSGKQCFTVLNDLATKRTFVRRHQTRDLYWGVSTRRSDANGTEANCRHLGALYADLDFKTITETDARARLQEMPLQPSLIVHSGGGLHCYWLLREPLDVQTENPRHWLQRLAAYLGADPSCAEPARVLRIPGTKNHKYDPPRPVPSSTSTKRPDTTWPTLTCGCRHSPQWCRRARARRPTARSSTAAVTTPCTSWRGP